jgi:hypothetical protein
MRRYNFDARAARQQIYHQGRHRPELSSGRRQKYSLKVLNPVYMYTKKNSVWAMLHHG